MRQRIKRMFARLGTRRPLGHAGDLAMVQGWLRDNDINRLLGRI